MTPPSLPIISLVSRPLPTSFESCLISLDRTMPHVRAEYTKKKSRTDSVLRMSHVTKHIAHFLLRNRPNLSPGEPSYSSSAASTHRLRAGLASRDLRDLENAVCSPLFSVKPLRAFIASNNLNQPVHASIIQSFVHDNTLHQRPATRIPIQLLVTFTIMWGEEWSILPRGASSPVRNYPPKANYNLDFVCLSPSVNLFQQMQIAGIVWGLGLWTGHESPSTKDTKGLYSTSFNVLHPTRSFNFFHQSLSQWITWEMDARTRWVKERVNALIRWSQQ